MNTTIAAIATAAGKAGIAVVRLSGPEAYAIGAEVFRPMNPSKQLQNAAGYTALFGHFVRNGQRCDEAVALCFRAPKSYTGEDVVELSVHGGTAVVENLLKACYEAGAVPAAAGEFTKRAFLSGRISLTQAEAVMEMINATSQQGAAAANAALEGALYRRIHTVSDTLTVLAGHIAAFTDYPEEDVDELSTEHLVETLTGAEQILCALIDNYEAGSILRRGVSTAIVGSPNVGKSTLLNLLAGCEKAIVTPVAGTTRDVVEQDVSLGGTTLLLADTAGMRVTEDIVEAEGIRRSNQRFEDANLVLAVFDGSRPLSDEDKQLALRCKGRLALAIINKSDLSQVIDIADYTDCFKNIIYVSAKEDSDMQKIAEAIRALIISADIDPDAALLANQRQLACAKTAQQALQEALTAAKEGFAVDAVSVCVDDALAALYELTGESATDAVIEEVFSKFCVGK